MMMMMMGLGCCRCCSMFDEARERFKLVYLSELQ
jgi:hypothetical protein